MLNRAGKALRNTSSRWLRLENGYGTLQDFFKARHRIGIATYGTIANGGAADLADARNGLGI